MSAIIWVDPRDCEPPHGLDMSSPHDYLKVEALARDFAAHGFDRMRPALLGYPLGGRIQLLSGTHRHAAALLTGTRLPITLWLGSSVEEAWGRTVWRRVMEDIPVAELERWTRDDVDARRP